MEMKNLGGYTISKAENREIWPLSLGEKQMAIEQGMNPETVTYNINKAFRISPAVSEERVEKTWKKLLERHRILRSVYPLVEGDYVHKIMDEVTVPVEVIKCEPEQVQELILLKNIPFDIANGPLIRCNIFEHEDSCTLHFCFHHIILDGGCAAEFFSDFFRLYEGEELSPIEIDFLDIAVWQEENWDFEQGAEAFEKMFEGGAPENDMPTHPTRPAKLPIGNIDIERRVNTASVKETAHRLGLTQYELLVSVLAMTTAKYCGSEDVVLGAAMSGRVIPEQKGVMGMFVNTLPLRFKPVGDMSIEAFTKSVKETISLVKANQTYPFAKIAEKYAPDRNASRNPVFDVMVNYLHEMPLPVLKTLEIEEVSLKNQALEMDILLEIFHHKDELRLIFSYSEALYLPEVVENFAEQYVTTLERIIKGEAKTVEEAAELPERQRRIIVEDFVGEECNENLGKTVVDVFREQVKRTPNKKAAEFRGHSITYKELDSLTDRIAAYLSSKGIGRGNAVALMIKRGLMMPIGALGVLKSGAAYVPLDVSYPADRLEYMISDAGADIIIGDSEFSQKLPEFKGEFIDSKIVFELPEGDIPEGPDGDDLFILLYTSGTTGKPKGVMLLHKNIINYMTYYSRFHNLTEVDNTPAYASFGFDAHMMDLYPTLMTGGTVYIIPEEMRLDLPGLRDYFEKKQITVAFMTTQLGRQFAETMDCPSLRALSTGGEALVPIEPPRYNFYNIYGPTECTVVSNAYQVDKLYDRVPIGRATYNTALYVVDTRGHLAPVGVAGEMLIAGRQVGKGYLNRPDLTEEKFIKNPFSEKEGFERAYRTGDIVRFLPSGDIDFVGRRDHQVKIRGFRIELTEIEGRIRDYEPVSDATVIAIDDAGGGKKVVAYITSDETVDIKALNAFIEEVLPPYMVPSATMQIEKIPLNQNGKVDRRKLPEIVIEAEEIVPPRNETERIICEICAKIVGLEEVGVTSDLMYAGLNSLSSIKAAALITEKTGKKITTAQLMSARTPEKIASLLEETEAYVERTFEKREKYPLTSNQMGLYFACIKDPGSLIYNIPVALSAEGIDAEKLKTAAEAVINAHPYIKTRFAHEGSAPVQLRLDDEPVNVLFTECSEEKYEEIKSGFVRPFNFFEGSLYRLHVVKTEKNVHLLADFHHIVFDGGSLDIFLSDLVKAYEGEALIPEKFTSFDLALSEEETKATDAPQKAKEFFHKRLSDCEGATVIPTDSEKEGNPQTVRVTLERNKVESTIKKMGITASNLFLSSISLVVGRFASAKSVRIATITNGREGVEVQNNLGMLVKTLPIAINADPMLSKREYLELVTEEMKGVMENLSYTYMQASAEYSFNAQLLYAYQGGVVSDYALGGNSLTMDILGLNKVKFPISVNVGTVGDNFYIDAEYDDGLFKESTMVTFIESIKAVTEKLLSTDGKKIGEVSVLSKEQAEVIRSFNKDITPESESSLDKAFEQWAQKAPDKTALIACDREYTYRELNEAANMLAHSLLEKGVKREARIPFLLHRDSRVLVAMLGILKAGCCYIPVDPDYPIDRINHVLEDSGAEFILTDGTREVSNGILIDTLLENDKKDNPNIDIKPEDLAYIIYTSGSTGKPKGVMLTHRGIVNYTANNPDNVHVHELVKCNATIASVTTVSFDMFLKEAFNSLMNGLTLVLADDIESKNPDKLALLMERTKANAFSSTPSRMMQYMQLPEIKEALSKCDVVLTGGEGYPSVLYRKLREVTDATLLNTYGPTEITVSCNGKVLESDKITIGRPLHNVHELVMDIYSNPLPVGVTGELYIGGEGLARGYFGNAQMTEERFVTCYGKRFYKSGDLSRFNEKGEVVILGRNDGQIKLRGLRIELGEIENSINAVKEITSSVVLVRKINSQEHLCAYYTAERELPSEELREILLKSLTKYMVPTAYLQMEALPMTPNGKVDRKQLPEAKLMQRGNFEEPANDTEKAYCEIFAKVLHLDKVGATDNFFDMGGTSLQVTEVTIGATDKGFALSYGDLFANPTPRELAKLMTSEKTEEKDEDITAYNYDRIHELLKENTIDALRKGEYRGLGNVCVTGATGFLGIHVLREFIENYKGTAYCVVRGGKLSAEERLKNMLVYYFSESYDELFGNRIVVIDGDITKPEMYEALMSYPVDTYINCAANVKHFSKGTDIEDINVGGVVMGLEFAKKKNCRFIQVSTASIAGMSIDDKPPFSTKLTEQMFYFGQDLSNKYTHSKFLAERYLLEACLEGLDGKIMRVGNLMARDSDGEFQVNFKTNNFLGRLKAYNIIGRIPYEAMGASCEFAPIDMTARAILLLAQTPEKCRVFHPYNDHDIFMGDVISTLRGLDIDITPCEMEVYEKAYSEAFRDSEKAKYLNSLIAYQEYGKVVLPIKSTNSYTSQALLRQGFMWPVTTPDYLRNFFVAMIGLGFFDSFEL